MSHMYLLLMFARALNILTRQTYKTVQVGIKLFIFAVVNLRTHRLKENA